MALPEILKQARKNAGLTQTEASELSGVPQSCISGYETGTAEPSISFLQRLAVAYKVKLSKLVRPLDQAQNDVETPYADNH